MDPRPDKSLHHTPGYLSWKKLQLSRAKLKASSKTSALLSGFAMVAMVEMQMAPPAKEPTEVLPNTTAQDPCTGACDSGPDPSGVPPLMLVIFAVCTTLLVAVHMLALMISTCILPNVEAVSNLHDINLVHESPHERLHWYIEIAWTFSTLIGLMLFILEIAILCWVKFYDHSKVAAWSGSVILIPVFIVFCAFAIHFYRTLALHKYENSRSSLKELESLREQLEVNDLEGRNGIGEFQHKIHIV